MIIYFWKAIGCKRDSKPASIVIVTEKVGFLVSVEITLNKWIYITLQVIFKF